VIFLCEFVLRFAEVFHAVLASEGVKDFLVLYNAVTFCVKHIMRLCISLPNFFCIIIVDKICKWPVIIRT